MTALTVIGVPVAKGRPRTTRTGHVFTPAKTRAAEEAFRLGVLSQLKPTDDGAIAGPLRVTLAFTLPIPASWSKRDKAEALAGQTFPVGRPDLDNLVKLATDALNGVLWADDSQIVSLTATKAYGEQARTRIAVEPL